MQGNGIAQDGFVGAEPASARFRHIEFFCGAHMVPRPCAHVSHTASQVQDGAIPIHVPRAEWLEPESKRFVKWLLEYAGLDADNYRESSLARRLPACLRLLRARCLSEARERIVNEPLRLESAVSSLLIGVTRFFREREVFAYLDAELLPRLSARGAGLRVWSVGCSDGAELYSIAMLLAARGLLRNSTLLGTDCRSDAIREATRGWFHADRLDDVTRDFRRAYFTAERDGARIVENLLAATRWKQDNALAWSCACESSWDLVLCRNLAMYLAPSAAERLWTYLVQSLRVGGILLVGKAERPERTRGLIRTAPCVFQRWR